MGIQKVNILDYGMPGTWKSSATITLLKEEQLKKTPNIQLCYLCAEANALRGIRAGLKYHNIKLKEKQLFYMVASPKEGQKPSFAKMAKNLEDNLFGKSSDEALKVVPTKKGRMENPLFSVLYAGCANFIGIDMYDNSIHDLGDIHNWTSDKVLILDSLSTVFDKAEIQFRGERESISQYDYKDITNLVNNKIILPLTESVDCSFILLGHPDLIERADVVQPTQRQRQEGILPKTILAPRTLGNKYSFRLPAQFSSTIYSYEKNDKCFWKTKLEPGDQILISPGDLLRSERLEKDYSKTELFIPI